MASGPDRDKRVAVLIDADNASHKIVAGLFAEVAKIGEASVRRIYGDFSGTRLKAWSDVLAHHAIVPHQNFANTIGKNASDIALVIDAMDLLATGRFDAFCLVSSDSDFTRLAARIREQGTDVFGFGEQKTPESFRKACKRFIFTENLVPHLPANVAKPSSTGPDPRIAIPVIVNALNSLEDTEHWYHLGAVGSIIANLTPDFDPRTYGCRNLVTLVERSGEFEVRRNNLTVHIRLKAPKEAV